MKPAWTAIKTKARKRRFSRCSDSSHFYWHKLDSQRVFKSQAMPDASFEAGQSNDGTAGQLTASSRGIWYMYDQRGNLSMQGQTSTVDNGFAEYEKNTHYYWLPNEFGDILVAFDQDGQSYAVYTDHINTPRLVTLVNNPLNPVPLSDTSNDLAQTSGDAIQGISPLAMPVWQMAYSPFGVDLANGYEAKPTTINNNFKPDLWEWVGLPEVGGASDWSWYAGGGNGQANSSVLTAPVLNIRYPGQYYDAESGLSQNWWRSYDARMGRYTQNDPIGLGGGMNRFGYAYQDGLNYFDPDGLDACSVNFSDYPIEYSPGKTSTNLGGHSGVLSYDATGKTRYYEYGRYPPNSSGVTGNKLPKDDGNVRRLPKVPNVNFDKDGNVTDESLGELKDFLSRNAGKNTTPELTCTKDADAQKVNDYAESVANNPKRDKYSWIPGFSNHCRTFTRRAIDAGR